MDASPTPVSPYTMRRGDAEGYAACLYVPRVAGRIVAHQRDGFSAGLWLARRDPNIGTAWLFDYARLVARLVPEGTDLIVSPPQVAGGGVARWEFATALGQGVAQMLDLPHVEPWLMAPGAGKGVPQLGAPFICDRDLDGQRVCVVTDLVVTGAALARAARALRAARASVPVPVAILAMREPPRQRRNPTPLDRPASMGLHRLASAG